MKYNSLSDNQKSIFLSRIVSYFLLIVAAIMCIIPFYIMIVNASRSSAQINTGLSLIPSSFSITNLKSLLKDVNIFRGLWNSFIIASSSTALTLYFSALTAYAFTFYNFPFKKFLFGVVLALVLIPAQLGIIGFYDLANKLRLVDTRLILILPSIANAFLVFFLRQYTQSTIPSSLLEAARMDGAKEIVIFHKIALPLMAPGIFTMGIFSFVGSWNNFIGPLVLINSESKYTIPLLIAQLNSTAYKTDFGAVYMGVAISVIPILVLFAILSRKLIEGVSMSGVKG